MIINLIHESCIHLFQINHLVILDISHKTFFKKTFNSEFSDIEVCFTDQNSEAVEVEQRIHIILLLIKVEGKKWLAIHFNQEIEYL